MKKNTLIITKDTQSASLWNITLFYAGDECGQIIGQIIRSGDTYGWKVNMYMVEIVHREIRRGIRFLENSGGGPVFVSNFKP